MEIIIFILLLIVTLEVTYLILLNLSKVAKKRSEKPTFVDTSALIDGRILSVARTGFLKGRICIPRSVIGELQLLADNSDSEKRSRARHGLDVVNELQGILESNVEIFPDSNLAQEGVDNRLLSLAKKHDGIICTIDYNLNKVARVEGIPVLNINDLAMSLRMAYLPGEKMQLELIGKGQDSHQAIGHLGDGTMVVVENGYSQIGQTVEVEFIRSLQTAAGKMMFAKIVNGKAENKPSRQYTKKMPSRQPNQNNRSSQNNQTTSNGQPKERSNNGRGFKNKAARSEQNIVDLANRR